MRNILDILMTRETNKTKKKGKKMCKQVSCFYTVLWCQVQGTAQQSVRVKSPIEHLFVEEAAVVITAFMLQAWSSW